MSPGRRDGLGGETEAISNSTDIAGSDTPDRTSSGLEVAVGDIEGWWAELALLLIEQHAPGTMICADDVSASIVGLPDHPNRIGGIFAGAARNGLIRRVGYHQARRAARHGGVHAVWERA